MASRSSSPSRKSVTTRKPAVKKTGAAKSSAGKLPEWNLADLYTGIDAPGVTPDLDRVAAACKAFEADYKGKHAPETAKPEGGAWRAQPGRRVEAIGETGVRSDS